MFVQLTFDGIEISFETIYNVLYHIQRCLFCSPINKCLLQVSPAAKQLIHGLLQRDPSSRLGSSAAANDIKQHPFFEDIHWPLIRCMVIWKLSLWRISWVVIAWHITNKNITLHVQEPPELDVPLKLTRKEPEQKVKPEEDIYSCSDYWDILRWPSAFYWTCCVIWICYYILPFFIETKDEQILHTIKFFNYFCADRKSLNIMLCTHNDTRL